MQELDNQRFREWDQAPNTRLNPMQIQRMYESGMRGAIYDPAAIEQLRSEAEIPFAEGVAHQFGFADQYAGQLVIPFIWVNQLYPGCWPGPAQERGDCVSHGQKNANLGTLCAEVIANIADEITHKIERAPEVTPLGIKNGVLSTEAIYWFRRHGGDGWSCASSARVSTREAGAVLRINDPEIGIDLQDYSSGLAGKFGRTPPSGDLAKALARNLFRTTTEANSAEEVRDMLGKGFFFNTCGSEGFSNQRDENGVSKRQGSWSHSMAFIGFDDRAIIKAIYGEPLVLVLNSWAIFNSGPRRIYKTLIDIPHGSFWARWSHVKNRYMVAMSGLNGWARMNLPDASPGF